MIPRTFRERLVVAMTHAGLTRRQLDRLMGWKPGWTKRLLDGDHIPPAGVMPGIARTLACSVEWLDGGAPSPEVIGKLPELVATLDRLPIGPEDREAILDLFKML